MATIKDNSTRNTVILIILGAALAILIGLNLYQYSKKAKTDDADTTIKLINSMGDTIKYYKGKDSVSIARISTMETENTETFLKLQSSVAGLRELQSTVKDYKDRLSAGSSVTQAMIETLNSSVHPTIVTIHDTPYIRTKATDYTGPEYVFPTYSDSLINEWIEYRARMDKDSSRFTVKTFNKFSVINGRDKKGAFADITDYNPFSSVKTIRSYQVSQPKPKKLGIGLSGGITYFDKWRPYVGIGINYNLIRF